MVPNETRIVGFRSGTPWSKLVAHSTLVNQNTNRICPSQHAWTSTYLTGEYPAAPVALRTFLLRETVIFIPSGADDLELLDAAVHRSRNYSIKISFQTISSIVTWLALIATVARMLLSIAFIVSIISFLPLEVRAEYSSNAMTSPANNEPFTGHSYFEQGEACVQEDPEKAVILFSKSIQLGEHLCDSYVDRGFAYGQLKRYRLAIEDYDESLKICKTRYDIYSNRGICHIELGEYNKALLDFNTCLGLYPSYFDCYCGRARAYQGMHRLDDALVNCNKCLEIKPTFPWGLLTRARIYAQRGQLKQAKDDYQSAITNFSSGVFQNANALTEAKRESEHLRAAGNSNSVDAKGNGSK